MGDNGPVLEFIAESKLRRWLTETSGFVLHQPGPGFELVCNTIDGYVPIVPGRTAFREGSNVTI